MPSVTSSVETWESSGDSTSTRVSPSPPGPSPLLESVSEVALSMASWASAAPATASGVWFSPLGKRSVSVTEGIPPPSVDVASDAGEFDVSSAQPESPNAPTRSRCVYRLFISLPFWSCLRALSQPSPSVGGCRLSDWKDQPLRPFLHPTGRLKVFLLSATARSEGRPIGFSTPEPVRPFLPGIQTPNDVPSPSFLKRGAS